MNRGNVVRIHKFMEKIKVSPVAALVLGGSITLGHGVMPQYRYSNRLQDWMNTMYPLPSNSQNHTVLNKGTHGGNVRGALLGANHIYLRLTCLRFVQWPKG